MRDLRLQREIAKGGGEQQKRNFIYRIPYLLFSTKIYDIFHNQFKCQMLSVKFIFISVDLL